MSRCGVIPQGSQWGAAVKPGDLVLFYHSNIPEPLVVGIAEVIRGGCPDYTAFDPGSEHFDPNSSPGAPTWYMVDFRESDGSGR